MRQRLAVFNSNEVNAYGIKMPVTTLVFALDQGWSFGQPMFLSHDRHRLVGWTQALGIHLEPGLARLTGLCCFPQSEAVRANTKKLVDDFFGSQIATEVMPHRPELEEQLKPYLGGDQELIFMEGAALKEDGLAERAFAAVL